MTSELLQLSSGKQKKFFFLLSLGELTDFTRHSWEIVIVCQSLTNYRLMTSLCSFLLQSKYGVTLEMTKNIFIYLLNHGKPLYISNLVFIASGQQLRKKGIYDTFENRYPLQNPILKVFVLMFCEKIADRFFIIVMQKAHMCVFQPIFSQNNHKRVFNGFDRTF